MHKAGFKFVDRVEHGIIWALIGMMTLVTVLATVELGHELYRAILREPVGLLDITKLLDLFGLFMMVLISMELLHSIKVYLTHEKTQVEVVFMVALIAAARKIIILDFDKTDHMKLFGLSAIVIALVAGYYLLRRAHARADAPRKAEDTKPGA